MSTKTFPTLHVASTITGIGLCEGMRFSDMQEIASHLYGTPLWTHELAHEPTVAVYQAEGRRQLPDMPTDEEAQADYQTAALKATAAYGDEIEVAEGRGVRGASPLDTLTEMVPAEKIIAVAVDEDQPNAR